MIIGFNFVAILDPKDEKLLEEDTVTAADLKRLDFNQLKV